MMKKQLTKNLLIFCAMLFGLQVAIAQNVFWEEDFSSTMGLPSGWTAVDTTNQGALWSWCASPAQATTCIPGWGTYDTQPDGGFPSTTADNGFIFMDSDVLGSVSPNHVARLTTTAIDCSGQSEVWAKFESQIGVYELATNNNAMLRVSTNGTDWTDFNIFDISTATRWSDNPEYSFIDISSVAAYEASVYLQFSWTGNWEYWWLLDDLQLYDADPTTLFIVAHDLRVNKNFYAISPNAMWPASQVECFGFLADIENIGTMEQTNVNLNITIEKVGLGAVLSDNLAYDDIPADSLIENQPIPGCFTPDAEIGASYTGTYEVSADSVDLAPENNFQTFDFIITDSVFAKEFGATTTIQPAASNWEGEGEPHSWAFGNHFYIVNGDDFHASSATFGIAPPDASLVGRILSIYLYRWDEDPNEDGNMDPSERTRVGFNVYEITGDEELTDLITLPLLQFPSSEPGPIELDSNQPYVLMLEYSTIDEVDFAMAGALVDYGAVTYRSELEGVAEGNGRYGYMLGVNGDLEAEPYSNAGFTTATTPVVRLNLVPLISNVEQLLGAENIIEISPNPAKDKINLNVDLVELSNHVNIRILDINGRLIVDQVFENVKNERIELNVNHFNSGAYFLHFITEDGVRTERFIIQH